MITPLGSAMRSIQIRWSRWRSRSAVLVLLLGVSPAWPAEGRIRESLSTGLGVKSARTPGSQGSPAMAQAPGQDPLDWIRGLIRETDALVANRNFTAAAERWQRAAAMSEKKLGRKHPVTQMFLTRLAGIRILQGKHAEADSLLAESLEATEKSFGIDSPSILLPLEMLMVLYRDQGRYEDAEKRGKRALEIRERNDGPEHPNTASTLEALATISHDRGHLEEAESLARRALGIFERTVGADHPTTAKLWNLLGSIQQGQARYGDAETLFLRALAIQERAGDSKSAKTASILANLASVYASQGRENEALALHQRALAILSKERGENHKDTAVSLNNIATLHLQQGRLNEAASFGEKALSAHKSALGLEHPDTASVMSNLAQIYGSLGRHKEAESLLRQALEIRRKTLGESHLDSANSLHALGLLSLNQARYEEADSLLSRALPIAEATAGPRHPFTATTLMNLTAIQLLLNKPQAAIPLLTRLNRSQADWLRRELPLQPRDQRMVLLQRQPDAVATTFLLLDQDPSSAPLALETRLNRQGLLAEIEQRQRLLLSSSPQTHQLGERLAGLDRQLASVILTPTQRDALRSQRQQLEGELNRLLPALRIEPVSTAQVAAALKSLAPQGLLIEFQKYEPFSRSGSGPGTWGPSRYVALLLHPDGRIASIPLGPAAPIDQAIERALAASSANQVDADDLWAQVSALVFNPLAPELRNVTSLFLSPDGALHRIPYAALNAPGNGSQLLNQAFQLRLLTTGRDLLRLQQPAAAGSPPVLIANPDYNAIRRRSAATTAVGGNAGPQPGRATQPAASATTGRQQRSADLASNRVWAALPGTADEARALAPLLGIPQPITGASATSSLVLRQNAPRLLHIATHGFFQPDQPSTPSGPLDNTRSGNASAAARLEDPLLRSGLVLAGANHPDADPTDDGYLTAAEVTGINLNGTELVTLSACESGLGDLQSGEGVYGLQRALVAAGARSTLLSLWKVDDDATRSFMQAYYSRLLRGEGRAEALAHTQTAFRNHSNPLYRDLYVWAAFQLTGDWRPISQGR